MVFFLGKNLVFIDSMQFMNSSIDKLVKNLSDEDFEYLVKKFGSENLEILKHKGAYPHEYMNSFNRFNEEKLYARKYFFSSTKKEKTDEDGKISDGHISIEDYLTCEKIWNKFKMKNMGDYHDHYLKKDVLLLPDVFQKFISTCIKHELDPYHYFSYPGLSWDAMLKMTDVKLENISDIDKYLFIEKGSRGGISHIAKRYAKANNKYMSDYDLEELSTFITTYLDKNNLYDWSMSEYLPYEKFEWLENIDKFDVMSINEKNDIGYFLDVDLEYPDELHELHNDYPLGPEKIAVINDLLSKYCKEIADKYDIKVGDVKKLIPNLI